MAEPLARLEGVGRRFGEAPALSGIDAEIRGGETTGLVGPDGAGKTTLIRLLVGLLLPDEGRVSVCGHDTAGDPAPIRRQVGYMPQRFGLYEDLTVAENMALHAELRGLPDAERAATFERLYHFTGLMPFRGRLAGNLSGGMKQKLGLACAMVRRPRLLLLDEPSVGVDPLSRRELWHMVEALAADGIGVLWSTSYLDEAERCATVMLLNEGRLLHAGSPAGFVAATREHAMLVRGIAGDRRRVQARALALPGVEDAVIQGRTVRLLLAPGAEAPSAEELQAGAGAEVAETRLRFEDAFVARLRPPERPADEALYERAGDGGDDEAVVRADGLTRDFGDFRAVDHVSFAVRRGEIFGLLGPNGAGKSTTFRMLCGLLPASAGQAEVAGQSLARARAAARQNLGYMSQKFSLYGSLSVAQNLRFFAGVYGLSGRARRQAIEHVIAAFELSPLLDANAEALPLGFKQRLALACAVMHRPAILFLDEPTSGVDPLTRREFWSRINAMAASGVTVLVTTHFLDEAEYCDRVGIIFQGRLAALGAPDALKADARSDEIPEPTLEDAFIRLIEEARATSGEDVAGAGAAA
ncbi:MAG TPA: ATP-binding cassette domain-containing protein [Alphaproteobacteria bacterium]|nr:ATP-binding cassette domain-containing protein [Alphaproteobacteria bacterium]